MNGIHDLIDERQVELFDVFDQLSRLEVTNGIEVPQLVVIGGQSSGKSSVLEAIAHFRFPVSDQLCTRFPTKLIVRRAEETRIELSIEPVPSRTEEDRKRLQQFKASLPNESTFSEHLKKVTENVLRLSSTTLKASTQTPESPTQENPREFTDDILVVSKYGPNLRLVNIVDLPGLFTTTSERQNEESLQGVRKMFEEYIKSESNLILLVISARMTFYNGVGISIIQKILRQDPAITHRVVGVIASPDKAFSLDESLRLLNGHANLRLAREWHVVKNWDQEERKCDYFKQRDEDEESFFLLNKNWKGVSERQRGIKALRATLSEVFWAHTQAELQDLVSRVQTKVSIIQDRLTGTTMRSSDSSRRKFLMRSLGNLKPSQERHARERIGMKIARSCIKLDKIAQPADASLVLSEMIVWTRIFVPMCDR
ncbi:Dynamin-2 [Dactylellina cionopaga]|nr:Dynamin-2 [Dactylellina cionopaga]